MNAHALPLVARDKVLVLHGQAFVADPAGVLFQPEARLMVVADLHLEKGSAYAARRIFLPPYDTTATLARLAATIGRLNPRRVVSLGDSFHDDGGPGRLRAPDLMALRAMQKGRDWVWVAGNHDPAPPAALEGDHADELAVGAIRFRHQPSAAPCDGEIAGHLHPVAVVAGRGAAVRRRCFVADDRRCVMPAFGAYAGGLNLLAPAFGALFGRTDPQAHVLGRDGVYTVARRQCVAESRTVQPWR